MLLLSACGQGKDPFLIVQLCLRNDNGVAAFKRTLQSIALKEGVRYIDASGATMRDLRAIGVTGKNMHADGGLIYIGLEGDDGFGLSAGNMGLNPYDVAIGFSSEPNIGVANRFADRVMARLKQNWTLKIVPKGSGALPDPSCVPTSSEAPAPPNNALQPTGLSVQHFAKTKSKILATEAGG